MLEHHQHHQEPLCPRCGYDLGGAVKAWTDRCSLEMSCSECGFEIDLSELYTQGDVPNWFVAAAPDGWGWIGRLPGTCFG